MFDKRIALLASLLALFPVSAFAAEPIFVAPENFSNEIVDVTNVDGTPISLLLVRDDLALSTVSLEAELFSTQSFAILNGKPYREKIKVLDGKREVSVRHTTGADCVEETFAIVRQGDDIDLVKSVRFVPGNTKSILRQNEKSLQKMTTFFLIKEDGKNNRNHKFHFQRKSETISKEAACTDEEINRIIQNQN